MRLLGIVLIVAVVLSVTFLAIYLGRVTARAYVRRRNRRADRTVPWTHYSRVVRPPGGPVAYSVGVERRTEDDRVLSDVHIRDVPIGDELERQVAEEEAKLRAKSYNDSKVGM